MAVSLAQVTQAQEVAKRRSMAYYPAEATHMPMPEHYRYPQAYPQQAYLPPPPPPIGFQNLSHPTYQYQPYAHLQEQQAPVLPPRPPKTPSEPTNSSEVPPLDTPRPHSSSTASSTIGPDPLPPHSNPQALTTTQSHAFEKASSVPPIQIGKEEIWSSQTGFALYVVTREAAHMPSFLSTKPLLRVKRTENGRMLGTIKFHSMSTSAIDMTIDGHHTSLSHSGLIHNRWGFQSTTCPNADEKWYWKKDKAIGGVKLEDSKKNGRTLARIKGDLLTFETGKLSNANCDEVLLSAIALAEAARRKAKGKEMGDVADAIGDFASSAGTDPGDSGGNGD